MITSVRQKPQYQALDRVKDRVTHLVASWLLDSTTLAGNQGMIIAEPLVNQAIKDRKAMIHPSSPSVILNDSEWVEGLVMDAKKIAQLWDEEGILESILDEAQTQEDNLL